MDIYASLWEGKLESFSLAIHHQSVVFQSWMKIHVGLYRNRHKATLETSPYDATCSSIFRQMERFNHFVTIILNNTVCEFSSLVHYKSKVLIFTEQREQFDVKRPLMTFKIGYQYFLFLIVRSYSCISWLFVIEPHTFFFLKMYITYTISAFLF